MTIIFYILLIFLNLTGQRKSFAKKKLETKMNWFFGSYSMLWLLAVGLSISFYFISIIIFIPMLLISIWLVAEQFTNKAILVYGKNKEILQEEFLSVNEESIKEVQALNILTKNHHK